MLPVISDQQARTRQTRGEVFDSHPPFCKFAVEISLAVLCGSASISPCIFSARAPMDSSRKRKAHALSATPTTNEGSATKKIKLLVYRPFPAVAPTPTACLQCDARCGGVLAVQMDVIVVARLKLQKRGRSREEKTKKKGGRELRDATI